MSSTDHIMGERQKLSTYREVVETRLTAFEDWVKDHPLADSIEADECDWDEAYKWWLDHIELALPPANTTFTEYLESIA